MTTASSSSDRDHVRDSGLLISGLHGSLIDGNLRLSDQSDGMLDGLLDSKGSAVADFSFSSLQNSLASMSLDSRFEPLPVSDGGARPGKGPRQFQIDAVNFDPPAPRQPHRRASLSRRASLEDDMSVLSLQSAAAPPPSRDEQLKERQASDPKVRLQKLAESMERSEVTRRQVMAQRRLLSPEQQRALQEAKGRLDQEAQRQPRQVRPTQLSPEQQRALQEAKGRLDQEAQRQPSRHVRQAQQRQDGQLRRLHEQLQRQQEELQEQSQHLSSKMASFFVDDGCLASGLEQGRRTIGAYMGQVNHGTLQ